MIRIPYFQMLLVFLLIGVGSALHGSEGQYLVGCGSADITGPAAGFPMEGYVRKDRISAGIHLRLRARAFIIGEPDGNKRVVLVCAELGKIHVEVYREVISRLKKNFGDRYAEDNVVMSATHTHSGVGGYWRFAADGDAACLRRLF